MSEKLPPYFVQPVIRESTKKEIPKPIKPLSKEVLKKLEKLDEIYH